MACCTVLGREDILLVYFLFAWFLYRPDSRSIYPSIQPSNRPYRSKPERKADYTTHEKIHSSTQYWKPTTSKIGTQGHSLLKLKLLQIQFEFTIILFHTIPSIAFSSEATILYQFDSTLYLLPSTINPRPASSRQLLIFSDILNTILLTLLTLLALLALPKYFTLPTPQTNKATLLHVSVKAPCIPRTFSSVLHWVYLFIHTYIHFAYTHTYLHLRATQTTSLYFIYFGIRFSIEIRHGTFNSNQLNSFHLFTGKSEKLDKPKVKVLEECQYLLEKAFRCSKSGSREIARYHPKKKPNTPQASLERLSFTSVSISLHMLCCGQLRCTSTILPACQHIHAYQPLGTFATALPTRLFRVIESSGFHHNIHLQFITYSVNSIAPFSSLSTPIKTVPSCLNASQALRNRDPND
ncbi:hypothetical protein EYC80_005019 [Monilinia laxa]|uniref:Uncharacterized protein n=1 Tax=Monilinia laxa TaxID=61186 RepID=A0A5N6KIM0_MONLA|nr:hypothetical protein EYC80_005019 [Monilinia laxa]